ncbi:MAG: hypothetical protein COZ06_34665 [Armatimonadetes bacterium CG_4_10_14_3_um_filter_66_18]|nr:hypothetical protein [Armatimonadota bacterium]OIP02852.1 MAG: hypothetical protein AUJ96_15835 [Armatimonadetes bacterium CG2_30_66_41]PIU92428.1 MAG: hypothetical protein COS65_17990 [Armatimonadetes bacterium CG06_land_8_20_14_3_00_66_21]PIX44569.1 MAG: hypothetical protein COZ57_17250 [Armatimonadetes bacterium CG_4_8_14_3_um_filter_66_20]PIY36795.1 MAG: hypothetical protein COZ06_34665 [Armatimonadetes bacterium CG_4_10_14_3_um_filter_66_18]PIZ33583.1 MAG: hypothetical protein COY42_29
MDGAIASFPQDLIAELRAASVRLGLSLEELVRVSVAEYAQRTDPAGEDDFDPIGFGMWANRTDMKDGVEWVRNLRDKEWDRFSS